MSDNGRRIDDIQSYPILTDTIDTVSAQSSAGANTGSLGAIVESTLREVLGWRPRKSDAKGFRAALTQSFSEVEQAGRTQIIWTPHSYSIQADLGAVTGAQASIYAYAKAALEQSLPLLDKLTPLRTDSDLGDVDAIRAIVHSNLQELVNELGRVGGPRVQRVDSLFQSLLGSGGKGQLDNLEEKLGLERHRVNTIEEERNLTDFLILRNHVVSLKYNWDMQRENFDRDPDGEFYLGTQSVLLSRSLSALSESVQQARQVMDSVFIGEAERQTIPLELFSGQDERTAITIAELLSWIEHVATVEGPRLIREGGKEGVIALSPTLDVLHTLTFEFTKLTTDDDTLAPGLRTPRVQRTLVELTRHLKQIHDEAEQINRKPAPTPQRQEATVVAVRYSAKQHLTVGDTLYVYITVKNKSSEPLVTQDPCHIFHCYDENETYKKGFPEERGAVRVGLEVQYDDPKDAPASHSQIDHPYRWGLSKPLAPGEECTIVGGIRMEIPGTRTYSVGLVREHLRWLQTKLEPIEITVHDRYQGRAVTADTPEPQTPEAQNPNGSEAEEQS